MRKTMDVGTPTGSDPGDLREAGYELVHRLGEGGMGEVWAAARFGVEGAIKPCAIKVIRPAFAGDEQYRRLFVAEGRVAMMLGHSNIVSVFDVGVVDDHLFMAMDWVDGVDLGAFRQQVQLAAGGRPLAVEDAVHIVGALLDALGYAHDFCIAGREHGIVHRDVSPGNVMVTSRGEVKLMDFGLAGLDQVLREGPGPRFRGTLRYLSREQARGRPEPASDLFAVGAILHELLDGRKFRHWCSTDEALVTEIFEGKIPVLERQVPAPIEALRRGLLEPRVELRIKTAWRALTALAAWRGYRNRRLHLEALYRQVIGEPRSGLTQLLSLGVHSELLDELRRRVAAGRVVVPPRVEDERPIPGAVVRARSGRLEVTRATRATQATQATRATQAMHDGHDGVVVRARPLEQVSAHRVAQGSESQCEAGGCDGSDASELDDPFEREVTEPWRGRATASDPVMSLDAAATAWPVPPSPATRPSRRWATAPRGRLAALLVLVAVLGWLSTRGLGMVWVNRTTETPLAAAGAGGRDRE
jgi:Protein kinase domain